MENVIPLRWEHLTLAEQLDIVQDFQDFELWELTGGYYCRDDKGVYLVEDERKH